MSAGHFPPTPPRPPHGPQGGWSPEDPSRGSDGYGSDEPGQYGSAGSGQYGSTPSGPVPLPAPAPGAQQPTAPQFADPTQERRRERKPKRPKLPLILSLVAVGAVLVLVVAGLLVVGSVNRSQYGPDKVAEEYLAALESGDIEAANGIARAVVPNGANEDLLDPSYLAEAADTVEKASVDAVEIDGDTAQIAATYAVGGQTFDLPLTAKKVGRQGIFFDEWRLEPPVLQTITVDLQPIEGATMNAEPFALTSGPVEYAVYPGSYRLQLPGSKYFEAADDQVSVGFAASAEPDPVTMNITISTTKAYEEDVAKAVKAKLDECVKTGDLVTDCGFIDRESFSNEADRKIYDDLKTEGIEYEIEQYPEVTVSTLGTASDGSFFTEESKRAKIKAQVETKEGAKYTLTTDISMSGTVKIGADSVEISLF